MRLGYDLGNIYTIQRPGDGYWLVDGRPKVVLTYIYCYNAYTKLGRYNNRSDMTGRQTVPPWFFNVMTQTPVTHPSIDICNTNPMLFSLGYLGAYLLTKPVNCLLSFHYVFTKSDSLYIFSNVTALFNKTKDQQRCFLCVFFYSFYSLLGQQISDRPM